MDGISDFNALHSRKHDHEVQLYAFDILVWAAMICASCSLERLSARRPEGITVAPFERGETGPELFRAACRMGLEGLVSKLRDQPYRGGRQKHWIKAISGIVLPS